MQSLWTSLSALKSSLSWLDRIGNNVANESTPGYAEQSGSFADTLTAAVKAQATAPTVAGRYTPLGWNSGTGVKTTGVENDFSQLPLQQTGNPTDLAIQGPGFFAVRSSTGQTEYTKAGNFTWSQQSGGGQVLTTPDGNQVLDVNGNPIVRQGGSNATMTVGSDGQVSFNGQKAQTIAIVQAVNPGQNMHLVGANAYQAQAGAGVRVINGPGATTQTNASGTNASTIVQGSLSMSNVNLTSEMTDMMQAQNMFDLNSNALSISNQMMQIADSIRP